MIRIIKSNQSYIKTVYPLAEFVCYLSSLNAPHIKKRIVKVGCGISIEDNYGGKWLVRADSSSKYSCERLQRYLLTFNS